MQERGLKSYRVQGDFTNGYSSLLMQERGLKSPIKEITSTSYTVAPYAGAWIEIL